MKKHQLKTPFDEWCDELDRISVEIHEFIYPVTEGTGRECWRIYYDNNYSPNEAIVEDFSYV